MELKIQVCYWYGRVWSHRHAMLRHCPPPPAHSNWQYESRQLSFASWNRPRRHSSWYCRYSFDLPTQYIVNTHYLELPKSECKCSGYCQLNTDQVLSRIPTRKNQDSKGAAACYDLKLASCDMPTKIVWIGSLNWSNFALPSVPIVKYKSINRYLRYFICVL